MTVFEPTGEAITLTYRNWRGKTAVRTITPKRIWFGSTDWHPDRQSSANLAETAGYLIDALRLTLEVRDEQADELLLATLDKWVADNG